MNSKFQGFYKKKYTVGGAKGAFAYAQRASKMARVRGYMQQRGLGRALAHQPRTAVMQARLGIERKFYDSALTATTIANVGDCSGGEVDPSATSMISTPAVGDAADNREGKRIAIDMVEVKGVITFPAIEATGNPADPQKVFVALVLDTQSNGAQLNSEDVFKNLGGTTMLAATPLRNLLFASRFKVLKQEIFDMDKVTLSHFIVDSFSFNGNSQCFSWYVPIKDGLVVDFNAGTTASIVNVVDNSLHLIAFATSGAGPPQIAYNARVRFVG